VHFKSLNLIYSQFDLHGLGNRQATLLGETLEQSRLPDQESSIDNTAPGFIFEPSGLKIGGSERLMNEIRKMWHTAGN
jgi:hypothetical protein